MKGYISDSSKCLLYFETQAVTTIKPKSSGKFPCIIHWNFAHFVVLNGFKGGRAQLNDPAKGNYWVSAEVFDQSFTGVCLMMEPGENFEPGGRPKSVLSFARKRLKGAGTAVAFLVLKMHGFVLLTLLRKLQMLNCRCLPV